MVTSSFTTSPTINENGVSSSVFHIGDQTVYENRDIVVTPNSTRTYSTVVRFSVPAVLLGISQIPILKRDGTTDVVYTPNILEGYEGYKEATVIETFSKSPSAPSKPIKSFKPSPVSFTTPYGSFHCGATLHSDLSFYISTGSDDPIYEFQVLTVNIPATNPATHEGFGDMLVSYSSEPFKDGFITREVYVTL